MALVAVEMALVPPKAIPLEVVAPEAMPLEVVSLEVVPSEAVQVGVVEGLSARAVEGAVAGVGVAALAEIVLAALTGLMMIHPRLEKGCLCVVDSVELSTFLFHNAQAAQKCNLCSNHLNPCAVTVALISPCFIDYTVGRNANLLTGSNTENTV